MFLFICPGVSSDQGDASEAAGDRARWEQVGTEDDEYVGPPPLEVSESEKADGDDEDDEDVPKVRSRP